MSGSCREPSQMSGSSRESLPNVREALPDVRVVGKPSRMYGSGQEELKNVRQLS